MESLSWFEITLRLLWRFSPVWIGMAAVFAVSLRYRARLGLFGKLFHSPVGMAGLSICLLYTSPSPRDRQKSRMPSSA